jgi:hypothetical protein
MNPESLVGHSSSTTLELSPFQIELEEEIRKIDPRLADCYIGSLHVFSRPEIVSRTILSAHGIREILEKLPEHSSVSGMPLKVHKPSPTTLALEICKVWNLINPKLWPGTPPWTTVPDPSMRHFLLAFEKFASDFDVIAPNRRKKAKVFFQKFNLSSAPLPEPIETVKYRTFKDFTTYFQNICHHTLKVTPNEFAEKLNKFEYFLLGILKPKPFDSQEELDKIIREAENDQ